jgi:hypothetical protein
MCQSPGSVDSALAMLERALDALNAADASSLPESLQANALRALERAEAKHTAARARILAGFTARDGYESDGHGSARTWLRWQTRITKGAAAGAVGWARRLAVHPVIAEALAAGGLSASWARQICAWTDQLPADLRPDADAILATAARSGADEADLARLALETIERCSGGHDDDNGTFGDRALWLGTTLGGAGRLSADLTPDCAAALTAVLDALAGKAGPEDIRTAAQRRHDALDEACRRLIAADLLPARAGQPTQIQVHLTLAQLRRLPGAARAEAAWITARAGQPGWLTGPAADAVACDATYAPTVTGHLDEAALDRMLALFLTLHHQPAGGGPVGNEIPDGTRTDERGTDGARPELARPGRPGPGGAGSDDWAWTSTARVCGCTCGSCNCPPPLSPQTIARLRTALLRAAADTLSGPGGLASHLRRTLLGGTADSTSPLAVRSLPLDLPLDAAAPTPSIPAHLRRAVTTRSPHCQFPGCDQPASACHVHHLIPRARGGPTALRNLVNLCSFHHLTVVHRWGWQLTLHPDGTTTATAPDGRAFHSHSHSPPGCAA